VEETREEEEAEAEEEVIEVAEEEEEVEIEEEEEIEDLPEEEVPQETPHPLLQPNESRLFSIQKTMVNLFDKIFSKIFIF